MTRKKKYTSYDSPVYDVMPSIFVEFANGSRTSSGFCLLKRCLRHSFDPKARSIMNTNATLFLHEEDGEMGIVLENAIPASMKDDKYDVVLAFTSKDLVATKCQCHAGGDNEERVVCVHALPLLFQLTMLLDDGLAEHLLVELCSRWNTDLEELVKDENKYEQMRNDIGMLMRHNAENENKIKMAMSQLTVSDMLNTMYATGRCCVAACCSLLLPGPGGARQSRGFLSLAMAKTPP